MNTARAIKMFDADTLWAENAIDAREVVSNYFAYKKIVKTVLATLETFTKVKAPTSAYLAALQEAREEINDWFDTYIDAAREDVKRAERNK